MKCNLQIDKNGELKVGGVNAPLFREAMLRTNQNEEASLKIWAVAESEGFKEFNVPPTYDNVIKYNEYRERIDSTPFSSTELSDSMNASIGNVFFQEDFMKSFTNEKGEFEINSDRLKKVGLYSSSEIYNLLSDEKVQRNVKKFYNKSLNFEAPITTSEAKYVVKSDNEISSLGFFKRENPDVVNETFGNIFAGVKSKEDFDNRKMKVDEQWEAVKYEDISNDFSDKTSIAQYVENPLTNELELKSYNNTYYETLFGTEIGENNEKAVEIIDLITSLTPEQLSDTNEIKHAFNTLSKELVKSGIDFVGIENQYGEIPSPKIIELLLHTKNILTNEAISEEGLQNYVNVYNEVFEKNQNTKKSLFDGIITNSMKIEKENISDASLFINNSLVKIKENVYKKVNRNYEDVYEAVYNLMKNGGKQVIPFDVSKAERALYKEKVIRELREFASKKSQGIRNDVEATNEELNEMSLLSEYFKEEEQIVNPKVEWIKFERLSKIKDVENWKSRFVQRMNKEMISQKMKGNELPLTITQRGLEMTTDGDYSLSLIKNSISNSLYSDLIDYGFLTNQDFLATEEGIFINEGNVDFQRNLYANNPNLISEYNGAVEYGQGTDLKAVGDTFIKVGGIVYEKVNGNVYGLVSNQGEQTWNRNPPRITTKPKTPTNVGKKTVKQSTNLSVNVEEISPTTNEIESVLVKLSANKFENLVGILKKSLGGSVITTEAEFKVKLKELSESEIQFHVNRLQHKEKQLLIINKTNPAPNEYNTWVRSVDDILTAEEAFKNAFEDGEMYSDFTTEDMQNAINSGKVTVYSSYPIKDGNFVTPSLMNAKDYAGGGKVYSKIIKIDEVAWIDESEGQYAKVQFMRTKDGNIFGATFPDGTVYVDQNNLNANTPIHEYGHLWTNIVKQQNESLYNEVIDVVKRDEQAMEEVRNDEAYSHLTTENQIAEEVLARQIGNVGEESYWKDRDRGFIERILDFIKSLFSKNIPKVNEWTLDKFQNTSLQELSKNISEDLLKGEPIFEKESETFKTLSSIPLLNEDEALKAYKNIYSNKMFDWKNQEC